MYLRLKNTTLSICGLLFHQYMHTVKLSTFELTDRRITMQLLSTILFDSYTLYLHLYFFGNNFSKKYFLAKLLVIIVLLQFVIINKLNCSPVGLLTITPIWMLICMNHIMSQLLFIIVSVGITIII